MGRTLRAFNTSVNAARQVENEDFRLDTKLDAAVVAAGRNLAEAIDKTVDMRAKFEKEIKGAGIEDVEHMIKRGVEVEKDINKSLYLTPHLMNVIREMYASPASRFNAKKDMEKAMKDKPSPVADSLTALRGIAGGKS